MKTKELIKIFEDITLNHIMPVPFCNPEDGLHFFLPAPISPAPGTFFIGSLSDWHTTYQTHQLCSNCTYLICERQLNHSTSILQMYKTFWHDILMQNITTQNQVMERIHHFPYPLHRHIACIVVRPSQKRQDDEYIQKVTQALHNFFLDTNLFYTGKEWIVLYSQEKDTSDNLDISYTAFSALLEKDQLDAGISYVCQLPEILRTLYLTASTSIELGKRLSIAPYFRRTYTYHQYNSYYIIHLCASYFRKLHNTEHLIYLTHPDITRLYYYDLENNNNLLNVLFAYLSCGKNLTQTSQMLYMHRNTILNKLNKIKEVLKHDFDNTSDHLLLLLSCMIMQYQHSYLQKNISTSFVSHSFEDFYH